MNNSDSFNLYKYYDENVLKDNCEAMQDIFVKCKDVKMVFNVLIIEKLQQLQHHIFNDLITMLNHLQQQVYRLRYKPHYSVIFVILLNIRQIVC